MTERPSSRRRWRAWSACCSSNSAPASCSTSRRCSRRRFGGEPAQRLGDEPLALGLRQRRALRFEARDDALVGGTDLLGGLDLLGPQLRELRIPHRRRLRDQLVDLLGVAAVLGPQRLDLGDPALVLGDDPLAALVRDVEQRALELPLRGAAGARPGP